MINLTVSGGTADQQAVVTDLLRDGGTTNVNRHLTWNLHVWGYGATIPVDPAWAVNFVSPDTFSVDDWGPHAQGSATLNTDGSATIEIASDLDVPMLCDVLMHMVGHIVVGYITQFDGPQAELTTAVGGSSSYWDASGDNVQEGVCEAFKDFALPVRARDSLSRFTVTRDTGQDLVRTMATASGWGFGGVTQQVLNTAILDAPLATVTVAAPEGPFTQAQVVDPFLVWTDGMETGSISGGELYSYGGHAWVTPADMSQSHAPIGTGGWIDEGALSDWESFSWPPVYASTIVLSLTPIRFPQYFSIEQTVLYNWIRNATLIMANASFSEQIYLPASGSYGPSVPVASGIGWSYLLGREERYPNAYFGPDNAGYSAPPQGVINDSQWAYGSRGYGLSYVDAADLAAVNGGGWVLPAAGEVYAAAGGASFRSNQAINETVSWPYGVAAGDFTTGLREYPH